MKKPTLLSLAAAAVFLAAGSAHAAVPDDQKPTGSPEIVIGTIPTVETEVGAPVKLVFTASVSGAPSSTQECTVSGGGIVWSGDVKNSSSGYVEKKWMTPGTYTISVSAKVSYSTSAECGSSWEDTDTASVQVVVKNFCPLP